MSNNQYSTSFGDITLTVHPAKMNEAASKLEKLTKDSEQAFQQMLNTVKQTSRYWQGDAAENERERFESQSENYQGVLKNLNNYAEELRVITALYVAGENANEVYANSLDATVFE